MDPVYTLIDVLRPVWWIGPVAFVVSLVATPIVRFIAYKTKVVDRPDDLLKPHTRPTAYLGGIAMCVGLLAGLGFYIAIMPSRAEHWQRLQESLSTGQLGHVLGNPMWRLMAIGLASLVITIVGLLDDIIEVKPRTKVIGQTSAAAILLVGGVGHAMAKAFFMTVKFTPPEFVLIPVSAIICFIMVIAACNAANLLDGLDGLCGGVTAIILLGFLALAVFLATYGRYGGTSLEHGGTDQIRIALCLAMVGAVLGFLPYNVPPASIFMGDAGSMLLGFFVATMMAMFCQEGSLRWFVASCAVFALPILDTALAVVRRMLMGRNIFAGDRSHLYDQLVDRGMSVKKVVMLFYFLAAVAAVVGVVLAIFLRLRYALPTYIVLLAVIWFIFYKLGMIKPPPRHPHEIARDQEAKSD